MTLNQVKAGALLNYVIIALNTLVGLLYTPFLLRMLGQSEFGLYSLALSVIGYLTILDFGFGSALVRYTAQYRGEGKIEEQYEMFGMFFILYLIIAAIALGLAIMLIDKVEIIFNTNMTTVEMARLRVILMLMAFNLAFTFPMSIWGSILTAYEKFVFQKTLNLIRTILNPLMMIVLLIYGYKAVGLVVLTTVFNVITLVLHCLYCVRNLKIKLRFGKIKIPFLKEISVFSFWIFINQIVEQFNWNTGQLILGVTQGTAAVAVFAIAMQLRMMYYNFSLAISSVFLPKVTIMVSKGSSSEELSNLFVKTGRIQFIIMGLVLSGFIVFGREFIKLWVGDGYEDAYVISIMVFLATLPSLIQNLAVTILMAKNKVKFRSMITLLSSSLGLMTAIPLSYLWGAIGCAITTSIFVMIGYAGALNIYYVKRIGLDVSKFWREIMKMSIVPSIAVLGGLLVTCFFQIGSWFNLIIAIIVYVIIYLPIFYRTSMNNYEQNLFGGLVLKALHLCHKSIGL